MSKVEDGIQNIKETLTQPLPTPPAQHQPISSAKDIKERLDWGEPAFTLIDVRDRTAFNQEHITGAQSMPMEEIPEKAKATIQIARDIYVYGENKEQTASAASKLREAGFEKVAEIEGGLPAWKEISGPTEGRM
ncbi:MAG: rhodanese-like domain-containing protein [Xenococcaceae cyanobacterium]